MGSPFPRSASNQAGHVLTGMEPLDDGHLVRRAPEKKLVLSVTLHGIDGTHDTSEGHVWQRSPPDVDRLSVTTGYGLEIAIVQWIGHRLEPRMLAPRGSIDDNPAGAHGWSNGRPTPKGLPQVSALVAQHRHVVNGVAALQDVGKVGARIAAQRSSNQPSSSTTGRQIMCCKVLARPRPAVVGGRGFPSRW